MLGITASFWASLLPVLIWLPCGKQHLGQPWAVIPCGMWAKIAEIKPGEVGYSVVNRLQWYNIFISVFSL